MMHNKTLLPEFDAEEILEGICSWVQVESPTNHLEGVNRMMDLAEQAMRALGARIERLPGRDGYADIVKARLPWGEGEAGILVLGHLDTVHPVGTITSVLPIRREGDTVFGPGIYDMKGGMYIACYALRQLVRAAIIPSLPITFLFIPDEEVGSPSSREIIEAEAIKQKYVLIPEPAPEGGCLIVGRYAFARFKLHARGKPAHAGGYATQGRSAIREMAHQILDIESMSDPAHHISLSVGIIHGGTFVNVVPIDCQAEVLAVMPTPESFQDICARMLALTPKDPEVKLTVERGPVRPLFLPNDAGMALYRHAQRLAQEIGFNPDYRVVGGGSDGNFTGALGIPTLDGLGVCGKGSHTFYEHLYCSSLIPRARLLAGLLATLS